MRRQGWLSGVCVAVLTAAGVVAPLAAQAPSTGGPAQPVLRVYGPGGPQGPMQEAAEAFGRQRRVRVEVVAGPEAKWIAQAERDADLVYGGAEYMLTQFVHAHPGLLDEGTRTSLHDRAAGILVRPGNPRGIRSLADLARPGVKLVDVNGAGQLGLWEDVAGRQRLIPALQRNIAVSVRTSAEAVELWKSRPELDAWVTYASWHHRLRDATALVELPEAERVYRGTPIALTTRTTQRALAQEFVRFLQGAEGHAIFRKWGWR